MAGLEKVDFGGARPPAPYNLKPKPEGLLRYFMFMGFPVDIMTCFVRKRLGGGSCGRHLVFEANLLSFLRPFQSELPIRIPP